MTAPAVIESDPAIVAAQAEVDAAEAARVAAEAVPVVVEPVVPEPVVVPPGEVKPVAPVAPETYDLKLPADSTLDASVTERTAAIARTLGLSNEAAQTLLDETVKDLGARETASAEAIKPGGTEWIKINDAYKAAALADADLGAGDPVKLAARSEKAQQALTRFFPHVTTAQLEQSLLASNPAFLKGLAAIGDAMSDAALVLGNTPSGAPKLAAGLYTNDGKGPITENATR